MKTRTRVYTSPGVDSKGKITNDKSNSQLDKAKTVVKKKNLLSKAKDKKQNPKVKIITNCNSPNKAKNKELKSTVELRKQTLTLTSKAKDKKFKAKANVEIKDITEKNDIDDDVNISTTMEIAENEEVEAQHDRKKRPNSKATVVKDKSNNKLNNKAKIVAEKKNSLNEAKNEKLKATVELRKQTRSLTSKAKGKKLTVKDNEEIKENEEIMEKDDVEEEVNMLVKSDNIAKSVNEDVEAQHERKEKPNTKATVAKEKSNSQLNKANIVVGKKNSLNRAKDTKPIPKVKVIKDPPNKAKNKELKATVELRKQTRSMRSKAEGKKLTVNDNEEIKENEEILEKDDVEEEVNMLVKSDNIAKSVRMGVAENEDVEAQHERKEKPNSKATVAKKKNNGQLNKANIVVGKKNSLNRTKDKKPNPKVKVIKDPPNKELKATVELRKQTRSMRSKAEGKKLTVNDNEEIMEKDNVDMMEESDVNVAKNVSVEVPKKERNYLEIAENEDIEQHEQEDITENMDVEEHEGITENKNVEENEQEEITENKDVEEDEQEEIAENEDVEEQYEQEEIAENMDMSGEQEKFTENKDAEAHEQTSDDDDIESEDECPDEVAFSNSRKNAMESLKLVREEITKMKNDRKEIRKKIHDRNVLQKKQKEDKIVEIQKRKLPQHLLEYVSKLPKTVKLDEKREQKPETTELMDDLKDGKSEELYMPKDEDFISLHGSTEFRACPLDKIVKRSTSVAASAAEFRQRAFFGNKVKRESVSEMKSKIIKQAVAGKL